MVASVACFKDGEVSHFKETALSICASSEVVVLFMEVLALQFVYFFGQACVL